jgi:hypothetical protein
MASGQNGFVPSIAEGSNGFDSSSIEAPDRVRFVRRHRAAGIGFDSSGKRRSSCQGAEAGGLGLASGRVPRAEADGGRAGEQGPSSMNYREKVEPQSPEMDRGEEERGGKVMINPGGGR